MSKYRSRISGNSLTVTDAENPLRQTFKFDAADPTFNEIVVLLGKDQAGTASADDLTRLGNLVDPVQRLTAAYAGTGLDVDRFGNVSIDGKRLAEGGLRSRILDALAAGHDAQNYVNFLRRVRQNPLPDSVTDLLAWLEASDMGIWEDGRIVAYKVVASDFASLRSGPNGERVMNVPGTVVTMPGGRGAVDADRRNLCSTGLHFCSKGYLPSFGYSSQGHTVVELAICPSDVVAVPIDYDRAKGRAAKYEVIAEIDVSVDAVAKEWGLVTRLPEWVVSDFDFDDDDDDFDIWNEVAELDDEYGDGENIDVPDTFMASPSTPSTAPAATPWGKVRKAWRSLKGE